jgi:hypothetical protein
MNNANVVAIIGGDYVSIRIIISIELVKNKRVELSSELQEEATAIHKFEDGNGEEAPQLNCSKEYRI